MVAKNKKNISLKALISHYDIKRPNDFSIQFGSQKPLDLEIGFGNGEFITQTALHNPERHFVGLEQHWERAYKTLRKINKNEIQNIRLLIVDARVALERIFLPQSIENVYCLFPCPWPKKAHIKHRLFSQRFLRLVNSRISTGGGLKIVTDHEPYKKWVEEQISDTGFNVQSQTIKPKYGTRFERKWIEQGQEDFFELQLYKEDHINIPVKEDVALKPYYLETFDPQNFQLDKLTGDIAVVLKDFVYDQIQKRGMIHLIVAEQDMTQHLWVSIMWTKKHWCIAPAEGHRFIPTAGVARALKYVHESANKKVQTSASKL